MVMFSIGACISRVADASWIRTCEGVKRCAPGIGRVGEARVFCETGWMGNLPNDLIDLSNLAREHSESLSGRPTPTIDGAQLVPPSYRSDLPPSSSPSTPTAPDLLDEQKNTGEVEEHHPYISPSRNTPSSDSSRNPIPSDSRAQNQSSDSNIIPEYYSMNLAMGDNTHPPAVQAATIMQSDRRSVTSPAATSSSLPSPSNTSHSANMDSSSSGDTGNNNVVTHLREKFDDKRRSPNRRKEENSVLIQRNPEEGHSRVLHGKLPARVVDHNSALVPDATYQGPFRSSASPYHSGATFSASAPYLPVTGVAAYPSTLSSEISKPSWVGRGLRKLSLPMFSVSGNNIPRPSLQSSTNVRMQSSSYERELSSSVRGDIASSYRSTQGHS